ncbi:hypothetical protein [Microbacterium hydrocarbonoxydans]|uniref:hypothetical protein n=1 Tax=Microbacterium hydrocarbonoxydans TaxID=273678 RepID=UPI00203AB4AF|nr:hypothetical protein [Microbacterium hydrocarbonoxydans]MCM3779871.1 hypothetical protein [Microbacterium hydrocarbonoxydans]
MGAGLVGRAIAYGADIQLNPNEFRLLVGMCLTALDADKPPRYFDSREALALILGRRVPDYAPEDEDGERERDAAFKAVKVALNGLVKLGAIKRYRVGGNGRRAVYDLVLDATASQRTAEHRARKVGGRSASPAGVRSTSQLGDAQPPVGGRSQSPLGGKEKQERQEESDRLNGTTSLEPMDNFADPRRAA